MHRVLVSSAARHLNTTELGVFVRAYIAQPSCMPHVVESATNAYNEFQATGKAPEYVVVYATRQVEDSRRVRRQAAQQLRQQVIPDLSDVRVPELNATLSAEAQTVFQEDGA